MRTIEMLGWLYWNPSKEIFTIPLLDRPVAWYGLLFVLGFIAGYFIINPIFTRYLSQAKILSNLDVTNWPLLISSLIEQRTDSSSLAYRIFPKIDASFRARLLEMRDIKQIDKPIQDAILRGLRRLLYDKQIERADIEKAFPEAIATAQQTSYLLTDRLCWFVVAGTLIGARLGEVFFYDWPRYQYQLLEIFKVWKGGLSSHGGTIGVLIALYLYTLYVRKWIPSLTFLRLIDYVSIPTALVACMIRIGNFINQEILGTPTMLPWGVIFGNPLDGTIPTPRHPVQLYESFSYLAIFMILLSIWKRKGTTLKPGVISGLLLILIFTSRFFLEFWKSNQESFWGDLFHLQMGQWLSLPFIVLGIIFFTYRRSNYPKYSPRTTRMCQNCE